MTDTIRANPCTRTEAKELTDRIRKGVDEVWSLLLEAHERKAWKVLGYDTWKAYVEHEFGMTKQRSYQLLDHGRLVEAIREATGEKSNTFDLSARDVAAMKGDVPAVTAEIKARVDAGEKPQKAAADVIAERRAAKAKADRAREETAAQFSPAVQARHARTEEYREQADRTRDETASQLEALRAEIEEKDEYIAALEAENAELKRQVAKFDEMIVQYERGGFDAVIAGKDEEIRVLETRLYAESADKASWIKLAKAKDKSIAFYRMEAEKRGYRDNATAPAAEVSEASDEYTVF